MKLLEQTVRELKGEAIEDDVRATVNLKVDLKIDESYVPDMNQRLMLYRTVASARDEVEIDDVLEGAHDRYGPLPDSVLNLADYGRIRVMADRLGIESIDREARAVVLKFRPQGKIDPVRLIALVRERKDIALVPPSALRLDLVKAEGTGQRAYGRSKPSAPSSSGGRRPSNVAPSWWTARAREAEVKPGFNKEAMTRQEKEDPRAAGGIFERVGGLLSDLLDQG
jgi:transcription-repair coupling factor (superfamily II helicase)